MRNRKRIVACVLMAMLCLTFVGCTDEEQKELDTLMEEVDRLGKNIEELRDGIFPEDFIENVTDTVSGLNDIIEGIEPALNEYKNALESSLVNLTPIPIREE